MHTHLKKHLIHAVFLLAMVLAVRTSELAVSTTGVVIAVVLSIGLLEVGLWLIRRRDARTIASATEHAAT
jgi:hypothetical protein